MFKLTSFVNSSFINPSYIRDARNEMGRLAIGYLTGDKVKMVRESLAEVLETSFKSMISSTASIKEEFSSFSEVLHDFLLVG